jgi:hypothetical protein
VLRGLTGLAGRNVVIILSPINHNEGYCGKSYGTVLLTDLCLGKSERLDSHDSYDKIIREKTSQVPTIVPQEHILKVI